MKREFEDLVGDGVYTAWTAMLKTLVPNGRTQRIAVLVAGMLKYASRQARIEDNSICTAFDKSDMDMDSEESRHVLLPIIEQIFRDAGVQCLRTNSKGHGYRIAEQSLREFFNWDLMPWE